MPLCKAKGLLFVLVLTCASYCISQTTPTQFAATVKLIYDLSWFLNIKNLLLVDECGLFSGMY